MELGEKIRQARLAAGLSQRQLAGEEITRNMLSLIENGSAKPSVKTLRYLAARLDKPLGYFLEEWASPEQARGWELLNQAKKALEEGRDRYARNLLEEAEGTGEDFFRRKMLIAARLPGADIPGICAELPSLDEELLVRAHGALERENYGRCRSLLEAAEDRENPGWNLLRGKLEMALGEYGTAREYLGRAEAMNPDQIFGLLEICCRELGDYKGAYEYACRQKR